MKFIIWILTLFPEAWLEKALKGKPNVFIVTILHGDELLAMSKTMMEMERAAKLDKEGYFYADLH